jgi:hypothetical protein
MTAAGDGVRSIAAPVRNARRHLRGDQHCQRGQLSPMTSLMIWPPA